MGWTFTSGKRPGEKSADYLINRSGIFSWSKLPESARPRVVKHVSMRGGIAFALEFPGEFFPINGDESGRKWGYVPDKNGNVRICVIVLTKSVPRASDGCTFGYKDISETSGPYELAPASFLKHLSDLIPPGESDHKEHAWNWREKCRSAASVAKDQRAKAEKIKDGDTIELPKPVIFSNGIECKRFRATTYTRRGKTKRAFWADGGFLCRLTRDQIAIASIIQSA